MSIDIAEYAKQYAYECHRGTNQFYDNTKDYVDTHVALVVKYIHKYKHLLPVDEYFYPNYGFEWHKIIEAAGWLHDVIEDCRKTPNDLVKYFENLGVPSPVAYKVTELVFAVTNEKGWTRSDRANDKYYMGIRAVECATYIKLCDRFGNLEYSMSSSGTMSDTYRKEYPHFREMLYNFKDNLHWMWHDMDRLILSKYNLQVGTIVTCMDQPAVVLNIRSEFYMDTKKAETYFEVWLMHNNVKVDAPMDILSIYEPI